MPIWPTAPQKLLAAKRNIFAGTSSSLLNGLQIIKSRGFVSLSLSAWRATSKRDRGQVELAESVFQSCRSVHLTPEVHSSPLFNLLNLEAHCRASWILFSSLHYDRQGRIGCASEGEKDDETTQVAAAKRLLRSLRFVMCWSCALSH